MRDTVIVTATKQTELAPIVEVQRFIVDRQQVACFMKFAFEEAKNDGMEVKFEIIKEVRR